MRYMIEPIGVEFSNNDVAALGQRFTSRAAQGYKLHSVFQVIQPGCLGFSTPTTTYLAVYVNSDLSDNFQEPEATIVPAMLHPGPPVNASKEELMAHYNVFPDGDGFVLGSYRFASLDAALRHARHQESLRGSA